LAQAVGQTGAAIPLSQLCLLHIPPISEYLWIPPIWVVMLSPPYFDHDAFTHLAQHVLDAPGAKHSSITFYLSDLKSLGHPSTKWILLR